MASFPPDYNPEIYDYSGSGFVTDECLPPVIASPFLVADSAAPIFPLNGDCLTEQASEFRHVESSTITTNSSSLLRILPLEERHVFLCFKEPQSWPALVEAADFDRLPRFLAVTIKLRKNEMSKKTRLTVCEGRDGTESSNGDVMVFPDMIRYKGLTHFDVDTFVDEVLVQNQTWLSGRPERLSGTHIFVCSHASHDARCGVSGPRIIGRLRNELQDRGLDRDVCVRPCTHIGGHKDKANVIVYSLEVKCYASVTVDDVPDLVDELSSLGGLVDGHRRHLHGRSEAAEPARSSVQCFLDGYREDCLCVKDRGRSLADETASRSGRRRLLDRGVTNRYYSTHRWWQASWWFESWEKEDTLAALAVVGAASSVAAAYQLYRIHARH